MEAASNVNAKVSSILKQAYWICRTTRSESMVNFQSGLSQIDLANEDSVRWLLEKSRNLLALQLGMKLGSNNEEVDCGNRLASHSYP